MLRLLFFSTVYTSKIPIKLTTSVDNLKYFNKPKIINDFLLNKLFTDIFTNIRFSFFFKIIFISFNTFIFLNFLLKLNYLFSKYRNTVFIFFVLNKNLKLLHYYLIWCKLNNKYIFFIDHQIKPKIMKILLIYNVVYFLLPIFLFNNLGVSSINHLSYLKFLKTLLGMFFKLYYSKIFLKI